MYACRTKKNEIYFPSLDNPYPVDWSCQFTSYVNHRIFVDQGISSMADSVGCFLLKPLACLEPGLLAPLDGLEPILLAGLEPILLPGLEPVLLMPLGCLDPVPTAPPLLSSSSEEEEDEDVSW